jgi:chorismate lyase/3-hydroxybenzoate synthase
VIIDALASDEPGLNVENPRQRPPIRYSERYGRSPPCFARGTITNGHGSRPRLLIGGTASVRDEESVHPEDLPAQSAETFCNLASLIRASLAASRKAGSDLPDPEALALIDHARVYYARENQSREVRGLVERRLPHLADVEYVRADLCRAELLMEIEGVARMDTSSVVEPATCRKLGTGPASDPR